MVRLVDRALVVVPLMLAAAGIATSIPSVTCPRVTVIGSPLGGPWSPMFHAVSCQQVVA